MADHDHDDVPTDPLSALVAGIDQMLMVAPQLARAAAGWHDAFKAEGFTDSQALYLTACQLHQQPGSAP